MTREEKLKLLLDTGEYDFIKYIPKENMWKLMFALAYIEDTIPMSDIDGIKTEIKTEISDYDGCADFNEGIRFGLRTALKIIDKHIVGKERRMTKHEADVIGGLIVTNQISLDAYKQIMNAAQDENEVGDVLDKIRNEITMLRTFNRQNVIEILDKYRNGVSG